MRVFQVDSDSRIGVEDAYIYLYLLLLTGASCSREVCASGRELEGLFSSCYDAMDTACCIHGSLQGGSRTVALHRRTVAGEDHAEAGRGRHLLCCVRCVDLTVIEVGDGSKAARD